MPVRSLFKNIFEIFSSMPQSKNYNKELRRQRAARIQQLFTVDDEMHNDLC